jgi:alanine dehydrogenase
MTNNPLILSNDEVSKSITVQECMDVIEELFRDVDRCQMPPKLYLDIPDGDFRAMPAVVDNTAGIKWCGVHLDKTREKRKINIFAKVLINDVETGELLAIMDGEQITAIRTAAVTGVATKYVAYPDASVAAFIGCGNQTERQIQAVMLARELSKLVLFDLDRSRCDEIAKLFEGDLEIEIADSLEDCVKEADIVTTLTPARTPFLEHAGLKDMVHINAIGADAEGKRELSQSILDNIDFVVYDNWEQCSHSGEIQYVPPDNKKQTWVSLGEVVSGKTSVDGNQTLFDATGLAVEDVLTARYIYEKIK